MSDLEGVTVTGSGAASAVVDQVVLNLAVTESGPDAGAAFNAAAGTATRALAVLADNGVDARSVRTADLTLGPRTEWRDGHELLLGYQATQRLIVHLDGIGSLGRMLSDVAGQVGNGARIEGLQLVPSDPGPARRSARDAAWADAWSRAEQFASLAGRSLGKVRSVIEHEPGAPVPVAKARMMATSADMPVAAGDAQIAVAVTVTWDLVPRD